MLLNLVSREKTLLFLVLLLSFIAHFLFIPVPGYKIDQGSFSYWFNYASSGNFTSFYEPPNWTDYPPFNVYIFWFFGKLFLKPAMFLQSHLSQSSFTSQLASVYAIKLPSILFNIALTPLIYFFLRRRFTFRASLAAAAFYAFNPAVIYDLAVWGQMDSVYSLLVTSSLILLLSRKYEFSSILLAIAILTKPQSILLLPFLIYMLLREKKWWRFLFSGLASSITIILLVLPFSQGNPISFLMAIYQKAYTVYPFTSINAYNFWTLAGSPGQFWQPDTREFLSLSLRNWGIILFSLFTVFVLWRFHKKFSEGNLIFSFFLLSFGFFFFMTRMHERYIFLALPLLALSLPYMPRLRWIYAALSLTFLATLAYILPVLNSDKFIQKGDFSFFIFVPAYLLLLGWSIWIFLRAGKSSEVSTPVEKIQNDNGAKPTREREALQSPIGAAMDASSTEGLSPLETGISDSGLKPAIEKAGTSDILKRHWPIALLCLIFFVLSIWNLGNRRLPETSWKPENGSADFYFELDAERHIDNLFLFIEDDRQVNLEIYSGRVTSRVKAGELKVSGAWKQWQKVSLNLDTQYLNLVFKDTTAEIGEIVLFSNGKSLPLDKPIPVRGSNGLEALVDEPQVLTSPPIFKNQSYFDEVYFARAGEEYLNEKVPFEWSHPPLGKLIISSGIFFLGQNPFAWRITGVIFSVITIFLVYLIGLRMFGTRGAWIAAFLLTFDFMHFTESRLATGETFIFFFIVLLFLFFLHYYQDPEKGHLFLFLSLVAFGLGFATKWITANSLIGLLILLFILRGKKVFQRWDLAALIFGGLSAATIYFLSYIPDILVGRSLKELWPLQISMYGYHSNLQEGHPFGSPWWGWPLSFRPLWIYSGEVNGKVSEIVLMGNPVLWWSSIIALIFSGWLIVKKENKYALFIVVPYLTQWLLYSPISRVLFIYHYYPDVLFVVLATTLAVNRLWEKHKHLCIAFLGLNLATFAFFFHVISGIPMIGSYWEFLKSLVVLPK